MSDLKKNSSVTLDIEDLAYGGAGVGRVDGMVIFVDHAVPGDRVRARITKKAKNHAQAILEAIEKPSERRIEAPCPLFGTCGGCAWQNLPYEDQLKWKQKQVADTLTHLGGLALPEIRPIIGSPEIWNYRNKMEYTFGSAPDGKTILGFHLPERYDRILEVPRCLIHPGSFDAILKTLGEFARAHGLSAYNQRTHQGFLRHAVLRHSKTTGGIVLVLITSEGEFPNPGGLAARLKEACPAFQGLVWGINRGVAEVAVIEERKFLWGDPILRETVNGLTFDISPEAFFQTNTAAAEILYQTVVEMAELSADDRILDAYCGAGAIALHCAHRAGKIVGVEISREAIWNARANARANGFSNALFISAPMSDGLALARSAVAGDFSRVIIDPPRGGMDKKSLAALISAQAPVFLYVSCNPSTLARDLRTIAEGGYSVDAVQPIDMFPHTHHIETIARLKKS